MTDKLLWLGPAPEYRRYPGDAGFDLPVARDIVIAPGAMARIETGVRVALPPGCWGLIAGRSSASAAGLLVFPSVIDNGWRGPLFVLVHNLTGAPVSVRAGSRIAQIVPIRIVECDVVYVEELPPAERGESGFGSTGGTNHTHWSAEAIIDTR